MANIINHAHHSSPLKNTGPMGKKRSTVTDKSSHSHSALDASNRASKDFDLTISGNGRNLVNQNSADKKSPTIETRGTFPDEQKLSDKAKQYLANLREQYGDYDFLIADDVQNPLDIAGPSSKKYFVMLSTQEIERMANDEAYANEIMGKVEESTNTLNQIQEKGLLGDGIRFKRLAISFDDDGNTKLFAELERMSKEQQERMEASRKKRAEAKREQVKAPPKRPSVPSYQELSLAIKASIQQYSFTTERVMNLLYSGLSNGNNHNISGHTMTTQSSTSINIEIEAKLSTAVQSEPSKIGRHSPQSHRAARNYSHQPSDRPALHNTVRIEAGSADELIEKAKNIKWDE